METLTVEKAHELLKRAVAEKGEDYVYQPETVGTYNRRCRYFGPEGAPSCIVGHVLAYMGVSIDPESYENRVGVWTLGQEELLRADAAAIEALSVAQDVQDMGGPWGSALREFEQEAGLVSA